MLAARAGGDARTALSALELACETAIDSVTVEHAEDALQRRIVHYDKAADSHYDTISAWIKATRGSDPDASLYYLAVMLEGGEDPRFIARRMVILASEDIGNADPNALTVATGAAAAVEHAGLPECQFALAQAAIYLSLAPKSDAAKRAIGAARDFVREHGAAPPPVQLRSGGRGQGYDNPHSHPGHYLRPGAGARRSSRRALLQTRRRRGRAGGTIGRDSPRTRSRRLSGHRWARRVAHQFAVPGRTCTTRPDGTCAVRGQATCGLPFPDISIVVFSFAISSSFVVVFQFLAVATTPKRLSDSIRASRELWMPCGCQA